MKEIYGRWLKEMFEDEIEEAKGGIRNERCFIQGTTDADEMLMHQENIDEYEEYIELLEEYIDDIEAVWE